VDKSFNFLDFHSYCYLTYKFFFEKEKKRWFQLDKGFLCILFKIEEEILKLTRVVHTRKINMHHRQLLNASSTFKKN